MRLSSKPISSPCRTDKFPPPLTRFLRSHGGNRSRGRSRASPLFVRKKNTAVETQEPSSPKVTCIGQVRVRRSKQAASKSGRTGTTSKRRCHWIRFALLCNCNVKRPKARTARSVWRRCFLFFQLSYRRKVEVMEDSVKREPKLEDSGEEYDSEEDDESKVFVSSSPPKNALLLMRCRSEPYRSSSLASRFWGSPSTTEDGEVKREQGGRDPVEEEEEEEEEEKEDDDDDDDEKPRLGKGGSIAETRTDPEIEEKLGFCEGFESSSSGRIRTTAKSEDEILKMIGGPTRPLILTRCKSEPARKSGNLDPETCFCKKRRFRFGERFPQASD